MKTLTYEKPHRPTKLLDELTAGVSGLAPVPSPDGMKQSVFQLSSDGDTITLTVPDDADEQAIQSAIDAHDPTPPVRPPTVLKAAYQDAYDKIAALPAGAPKTAMVAQMRFTRLMLRELMARDGLTFHDWDAAEIDPT